MTDVTERAGILIVDDSPEKIVALESILDELGQDIVKASSGRDALRHLLTRDFAVILLDVRMPVMDGFETAALIRQRPRSEHTPIIFVTAFPDETHVARGYSLKAVDYIFTPVVPDVLRTKVSVFVDLFRLVAAFEKLLPNRVDGLALGAHHVVVFEQILADVEVALFDLLLRVLHALGDPGMLDGLVVGHAHPVHQVLDLVAGEDAHEIVFERQVEAR